MLFLSAVITACLVQVFCACTPLPAVDKSTVRVVLTDCKDVVASTKSISVVRGEDAVFDLTTLNGCRIIASDYPDSELRVLESDKVCLVLRKVMYPTLVKLDTSYRTVKYMKNDGSDDFFFSAITDAHKRVNTALPPVSFQREGYTLIGWNTSPTRCLL